MLPIRWLIWYAVKSNQSIWSAPPPLPDFRRRRQLTRTTQPGFGARLPYSLVLWTSRLLGARMRWTGLWMPTRDLLLAPLSREMARVWFSTRSTHVVCALS